MPSKGLTEATPTATFCGSNVDRLWKLSDLNKGQQKKDPMALAMAEARTAAERGEVPVGAVLVDGRDGTLLAHAHNRVEELRDPTAHAELLVLQEATRRIGEKRLTEADLYVTLEPCPMCAGAISLARIRRLYFAAYDPKSGGVEHGSRVFEQATCHHAPEVVGGLRESEAGEILKEFFRARR